MFARLLLLFAIIPLLELWLLIELTKLTSLWWTIALVMTTGMLGMTLVRWQGLQALRQIQQATSTGQSPSRAIVSGVLVLVAGALLLTPGILTDTAGFLLCIPAIRNAVAGWLQKRLMMRVVQGVKGSTWVSSFSASFTSSPPGPASDDMSNERPSVRVIDPNEGRGLAEKPSQSNHHSPSDELQL